MTLHYSACQFQIPSTLLFCTEVRKTEIVERNEKGQRSWIGRWLDSNQDQSGTGKLIHDIKNCIFTIADKRLSNKIFKI